MTRSLLTTTALTCLAWPAFADVTPADVWGSWKALIESSGADITIGGEAEQGNRINLRDIVWTVSDGSETFTLTIPKLVFTGNPDGTVSIVPSARIPMQVIPRDGGTVPEIEGILDGVLLTASGDPEAVTYELTSDRIGVAAAPGTYDSAEITALEAWVDGLAGTGSLSQGETVEISYAMTAEQAVLDMDVLDGNSEFDILVRFDGIGSEFGGAFPQELLDNPDAFDDQTPPDFDMASRTSIEAGLVEFSGDNFGSIFEGLVTFADVGMGVSMAVGDTFEMTYDVGLGQTTVGVQVDDGDYDDFTAHLDAGGIEAEMAMALPVEMLNNDAFNPTHNDDLAISLIYGVAPTTFGLVGTIEGDTGAIEYASDGGDGRLVMSSQEVEMDTQGGAMSFAASGFEIPFPLRLALEETGYSLSMPLSKRDTPAPVTFGLNLRGLTMGDALWNLFDPGQQIPRDPVTAVIDISGMGRPMFDFLDPLQQMYIDQSDMPFEFTELSLNALELSGGGADVTGSGGFTFDNSDLQSFGGMPRPTGEVEFTVRGVNGLISTLIDMGLIGSEEAMGARMALGMLTVPVGDDVLQSKIGISEDGQIFANGQRLK